MKFLAALTLTTLLSFSAQAGGPPCQSGYYKLRVTEAPVTAGPTYTDAIHYVWLDGPELDAQAKLVADGAETLTARSCAYKTLVVLAVSQIVEARYYAQAWPY